MAVVRLLRREPVTQRVEQLLGLGNAAAHPHQVLRGPVRIIDATFTSPQPTLFHRGDQLFQLGDFA